MAADQHADATAQVFRFLPGPGFIGRDDADHIRSTCNAVCRSLYEITKWKSRETLDLHWCMKRAAARHKSTVLDLHCLMLHVFL